MASKRTKKHRPFDAMAAMKAKLPLSQDQRRDVALVMLAAFNALTIGRGSAQCWAHVASAINVGMMMCEIGIHPDKIEIFRAAQAGLIRTRGRGSSTGKWGFDGDALRDITQAINVHQDQYRIATKQQVQQAIYTVHDRVQSGEYM